MRRTVAVFALVVLGWSQLSALRCDMGTPASMPDAPAGHDHPSTEEAPATPHGEHPGDGGGCLMALVACGAASARPAQSTLPVRFPAVAVQANLQATPLPVAVALGVETPPPRHSA